MDPDPGPESTHGTWVVEDRYLRAIEWVLLATGALVIATLWDAHGISWDESIRAEHGELLLSYFASLGADRAVNEHETLRLYTALPDLIAALFYQGLPEWKYAIRHLVSALFALAVIPALFRFARLMGEPWAGPLASAGLLTMPVFFGHAFINSKDIPLACALAWAVVGMVWFLRDSKITWRGTVLCGLALGFPLTIRPGIWPLLLVLFAAGAGYGSLVQGRRLPPLSRAAAVWVISWLVMVAVWPWAHENPLLHPLAGIVAAGAFPTVVPVLFDGTTFLSDSLPRRYLLQMLLLKTPIPLLLLAALGLAVGVKALWSRSEEDGTGHFLGILWFAVPVGAWSILTPNIYDGIRHFLFVLPALAIWAALGGLRILRWVPAGWGRLAVGSAIVLLLLAPIWQLIRLHPYEMTYYNHVAGGVGRASERFETDYWVTSYREAAEWVSIQAQPMDRPVRVLVAANELSVEAARFFLPEGAEVEANLNAYCEEFVPQEYDYYIATSRFDLSSNFPASPVLFSVGREGAIFTVVRGAAGDPT